MTRSLNLLPMGRHSWRPYDSKLREISVEDSLELKGTRVIATFRQRRSGGKIEAEGLDEKHKQVG